MKSKVISPSAFHATQGEPGNQPPAQQQEQHHHGEHHDKRCSPIQAPFCGHVRLKGFQSQRKRPEFCVLENLCRHNILRPCCHEREQSGDNKCRRCKRENNFVERLELVAPIDPGGFFKACWNRIVISFHRPDAERKCRCRICNNNPYICVDEPKKNQHEVQGQQQHGCRKHLRNEETQQAEFLADKIET